MKRLVGWFAWFLECSLEALAKRAGFNEKTLRLWAKGKIPLTRDHLGILGTVARLPMELIDAVLLPSLATLWLGKEQQGEVATDLAELAQGAETGLAGLGRAAVVELVGALVAQPTEVREPATAQWERLRLCTDAALAYLVEALPELRSLELAVLMADASEAVAADDAGRALVVARAAHRLGELTPGLAGPSRAALEAHTLTLVTNALRVANEPQEADVVLGRAISRWEEAAAQGQILLPLWRRLGFEASLRRCQRRFPDALARLTEAQAAAPPEGIAWVLAKRAATLVAQGDEATALAVLREAAPHVALSADRRLPLTVAFNTGSLLVDLGQFEEAERHWPAVEAALVEPRKALDEILMVWLRARIDAGLEKRAEAREGFNHARREYATRKMAANYAVVSLERAVLDLKEGRYAEVKELAVEMEWIFNAKGLHTQALAALSLFRTAAEREALTLDVAERMVRYLYRAQYDPEVKFAG
ncbi:MAG TPA: hypothetical protein DD490_30150 [Acidobacteria bacterium]|nr:hypothetical protein [Acidobacteriota bacterium]